MAADDVAVAVDGALCSVPGHYFFQSVGQPLCQRTAALSLRNRDGPGVRRFQGLQGIGLAVEGTGIPAAISMKGGIIQPELTVVGQIFLNGLSGHGDSSLSIRNLVPI